MYAGKIVEQGSVRDLFRRRSTTYTQALLGSMPKLGSKEPLYAIPGASPQPRPASVGLCLPPRCAHAMPQCVTRDPDDHRVGPNWTTKCWLLDQQTQEEYASATA